MKFNVKNVLDFSNMKTDACTSRTIIKLNFNSIFQTARYSENDRYTM